MNGNIQIIPTPQSKPSPSQLSVSATELFLFLYTFCTNSISLCFVFIYGAGRAGAIETEWKSEGERKRAEKLTKFVFRTHTCYGYICMCILLQRSSAFAGRDASIQCLVYNFTIRPFMIASILVCWPPFFCLSLSFKWTHTHALTCFISLFCWCVFLIHAAGYCAQCLLFSCTFWWYIERTFFAMSIALDELMYTHQKFDFNVVASFPTSTSSYAVHCLHISR